MASRRRPRVRERLLVLLTPLLVLLTRLLVLLTPLPVLRMPLLVLLTPLLVVAVPSPQLSMLQVLNVSEPSMSRSAAMFVVLVQ